MPPTHKQYMSDANNSTVFIASLCKSAPPQLSRGRHQNSPWPQPIYPAVRSANCTKFINMHAARQLQLRAADLCALFDGCFAQSDQTCLVGGAPEPLYLPATTECEQHRIFFTQDYFASALHEVAHWCIAGDRRRRCVDYGYWYAPDGRDAAQQTAFEQVEVKPQALEWLFSEACGTQFCVSADNLNESIGASSQFRSAIVAQALKYSKHGLPTRAQRFLSVLAEHYGVTDPLNYRRYCLQRLR